MENIKWDWEYEEYPKYHKVIIKTNYDNRLINYFTDNTSNRIPEKYIIHGSIIVDKLHDQYIVDEFYNKSNNQLYYIVRYMGIDGSYVQLGFKEEDLIFL